MRILESLNMDFMKAAGKKVHVVRVIDGNVFISIPSKYLLRSKTGSFLIIRMAILNRIYFISM